MPIDSGFTHVLATPCWTQHEEAACHCVFVRSSFLFGHEHGKSIRAHATSFERFFVIIIRSSIALHPVRRASTITEINETTKLLELMKVRKNETNSLAGAPILNSVSAVLSRAHHGRNRSERKSSMEHEHGDEDDSPEAKCGFVLHITVLIFSGLYTAFTLLALIRPSNTADSILMTFLSWFSTYITTAGICLFVAIPLLYASLNGRSAANQVESIHSLYDLSDQKIPPFKSHDDMAKNATTTKLNVSPDVPAIHDLDVSFINDLLWKKMTRQKS